MMLSRSRKRDCGCNGK